MESGKMGGRMLIVHQTLLLAFFTYEPNTLILIALLCDTDYYCFYVTYYKTQRQSHAAS